MRVAREGVEELMWLIRVAAMRKLAIGELQILFYGGVYLGVLKRVEPSRDWHSARPLA